MRMSYRQEVSLEDLKGRILYILVNSHGKKSLARKFWRVEKYEFKKMMAEYGYYSFKAFAEVVLHDVAQVYKKKDGSCVLHILQPAMPQLCCCH